jgi:hypothetical protein
MTSMKKLSTKIIFLLVISIGLPAISIAQNYLLNGVVLDQVNNAHLAYVNIGVNNARFTTYTDINGLFTIRSNEPIRLLLFANKGYQPLLINVTDKTSPLIIRLIPSRQSIDSLTADRSDIYHYIDSVMHMDQYAQMKRRQESLLSGEIPIGWFSLDMSRVKRFNQYEGVYLGLGGHTNEELFKAVSIGGFAGYGFKDHKTKYGFDVSGWPDEDKIVKLNAGYSYDTQESGGSQFFDDKSEIFEPSSFRSFYISKMNYERKMHFAVTITQKNFVFYGALQRRIIERGYDISDGTRVLLPDLYNVSGIVMGLELAPGRNLFQIPDDSAVKSSSYPVFWFQLTHGVPGMFNGDFNYNRFEGKMLMVHSFNRWGRSSLQVVGSLLKGNAPYFEYFNGRGTYGNFGLYASGSFVTMHPNEFMNDQSINFFFTHTFGDLFSRTEYFNPCPALVFNYGWGKIQNGPSYYSLPVTDMQKGFLEAGVQIDNLLDLKIYGVGFGVYYRMGAYRYATTKENLVFKIVISFPEKG